MRILYPIFADISRNQAVVDFAAMKRGGIAAVAIKGANGAGPPEPHFAARVAAAKAAGLQVGVYLFGTGFRPVADQVANLDGLRGGDGSLVPILDFETNPDGTTMTAAMAAEFAAIFYARHGFYPALYLNEATAATLAAARPPSPLRPCPLWVARYPETAVAVTTLDADRELAGLLGAWPGGVVAWQYWGGEVGPEPHACPGVAGPCDRSVLFVPPQQVAALWAQLTTPRNGLPTAKGIWGKGV